MRDAFGGAFMIRLFLVFIIIYMFLTAIAINYAKAFKVKNGVIDYLEDNEIYDVSGLSSAALDNMERHFENEILGKLNYYQDTSSMNCRNSTTCGAATGCIVAYCQNGIKIEQISPTITGEDRYIETNKLGVYYRVTTYFTWSTPFIKALSSLGGGDPNGRTAVGIWEISGETRPIVRQ